MNKLFFTVSLLISSSLMATTSVWQAASPDKYSKRTADGILNGDPKQQEDIVQKMNELKISFKIKFDQLKKFCEEKKKEVTLMLKSGNFPKNDINFYDKKLKGTNTISSKPSLQKLVKTLNVDSEIKIMQEYLEKMDNNIKAPGSQVLVDKENNKWMTKEEYFVLHKPSLEAAFENARSKCELPVNLIKITVELYDSYKKTQASQ